MYACKIEKNADLIYGIRGLGMAGCVLHVGAHPDDEDIGVLAYLSRKYGVRVVYWSATRGESGQNRVGPYRDEALGVYRTWESQDARSYDGAESMFGPFYDFGYSKNAEEALAKWGKGNLVRELVRAIRTVQPHILISRWTGEKGDLHGHHQAVGLAAMEAFGAAADEACFPELRRQGIYPWQALKYYVSTDNSGADLTCGGAGNLSGCMNPQWEKEGLLRINTGEFDPISGHTYQERAWMAYNRHQTQAMGLAPAPGPFYYYFRLIRSLVDSPGKETDVFDGMDPSLAGLADSPGNGNTALRGYLEAVKGAVEKAFLRFRLDRTIDAADALLEGMDILEETRRRMPACRLSPHAQPALKSYLDRKMAAFHEVTARALGLRLEGLSDHGRIIPGQEFGVTGRLWNPVGIGLKGATFRLEVPEMWEVTPLGLPPSTHRTTAVTLGSDDALCMRFKVFSSPSADLTCPYWLKEPRESYRYRCPEDLPAGLPFEPPSVCVVCTVKLGSREIRMRSPAVFREAFPGGFRELPLAVIPPISLRPKRDRIFVPSTGEAQHLDVEVNIRNNSGQPVDGIMEWIVPPGWDATPRVTAVSLGAVGETMRIRHRIAVPANPTAGHHVLRCRMHCSDRDYGVVVGAVRQGVPGLAVLTDGANCIREEFVLEPSRVDVHILDVRFVKGLRYAYIEGAEEGIRDALGAFGVRFHPIADDEMGSIDLEAFDAILAGPNAYLIRGELRKYAARFLEYVKAGGTLIVQYQGYGYEGRDMAPYPFCYSRPHDRVTHEDAPVKILDPEHFLFRLPNPIGSSDFDGWIRDRGLYFFGQWDNRYGALLSSADPGEEPHGGGMLECQYGHGTFLYTGYSFFRQLPAGVPGAFRLFANLLALPEARVLERIDFLKRISLFSMLTDDQLNIIARIMAEKWVGDGEWVCTEGEVGDELYVVYRGEIEVLKRSSGGLELLAVMKQGTCLGEIAVLGDVPRTASLKARGNARLLVIKGPDFLSLLRKHPDMSIQMIRLLVERLVSSGGTK